MNLDESIKAVAGGDVVALKTLYEEMRVIVYAVALSILRNKASAEDVLQETFIKVFENALRYQPGTNLKAWVVTIARNLAYDALRCEKRHYNHISETMNSTTDVEILQRITLTNALLRLGEVERQIVVLHLVAGFKHFEISEQLGIPAGTVRWKYRQSLSKLSMIIGDDINEETTHRFRTKG